MNFLGIGTFLFGIGMIFLGIGTFLKLFTVAGSHFNTFKTGDVAYS